MKRHLKEERYKEYLRICNAIDENYVAQRNLGYIKLEEPIPHGWKSYWILREDIARRKDADIFLEIIRLCGSMTYHKTKKTKKGDYIPNFSNINKAEFDSLEPKIQKYFTERTIYRAWAGKEYYCNVPKFFFEIKTVRHYKTHQKVIDEILLQEESELKSLRNNYREFFYKSYGAPKYFVNHFNRKFRKESKNTLDKIIKKEMEVEFSRGGRNSAQWAWW